MEKIDYINAHGTSTPVGDVGRNRGDQRRLRRPREKAGRELDKVDDRTSARRGGAAELIFCIKAIEQNILPPTINLDNPDPACDLDYVPHKGRNKKVDVVITTSFGFGGHNACLAFSRAE